MFQKSESSLGAILYLNAPTNAIRPLYYLDNGNVVLLNSWYLSSFVKKESSNKIAELLPTHTYLTD